MKEGGELVMLLAMYFYAHLDNGNKKIQIQNRFPVRQSASGQLDFFQYSVVATVNFF
jgi:hypothetical protein